MHPLCVNVVISELQLTGNKKALFYLG
jgi:hypothetical protein